MTLLLRQEAATDESWRGGIDRCDFHDPRWHTRCVSPRCTDSVAGSATTPHDHGLRLVMREPHEPIAMWRQRWLRTPDVVLLQQLLNAAGADLVVDGVYGPATEAAVRTWRLLRRRDARQADRSVSHREADKTASL